MKFGARADCDGCGMTYTAWHELDDLCPDCTKRRHFEIVAINPESYYRNFPAHYRWRYALEDTEEDRKANFAIACSFNPKCVF